MKSQQLSLDDLSDFEVDIPEIKISKPKIKFIEYRPSYFTGFENVEYEVDKFDEILKLPFVANFSTVSEFYGFFITHHKSADRNAPLKLMALYDWDDEFYGCKSHLVIGNVYNVCMAETGLKYYGDFIRKHKFDCWTRKYHACQDLISSSRPPEFRLNIAKKLGWCRDDFFGIAVHCDCGLIKKEK